MTPNVTTTPEPTAARADPPMLAGDRASLEAWLEYYRQTLLIKVGGLTPEQMCQASVPPSDLTLIGLLRHLSEVEQYWCVEVVTGVELDELYCSQQDPDGDLHNGSPASVPDDYARYLEQLEAARLHLGTVTDLDAPVAGLRRGEPLNLRWILTHLIEEYARHLGHADLIREAIDGRVGE